MRHFDTVNAGPKREPASYHRMTQELGVGAAEIAFYSDVPAELDAAAEAGWQTIGVARPGEPYADADFGPHRTIAVLDEFDVRNVHQCGCRWAGARWGGGTV